MVAAASRRIHLWADRGMQKRQEEKGKYQRGSRYVQKRARMTDSKIERIEAQGEGTGERESERGGEGAAYVLRQRLHRRKRK